MQLQQTSKEVNKFEEYKHSGIEWIGKIPSHWRIIRVKYLFQEIDERSNEGSEDLLSVSQYTGVTLKSDRIEEGELITNAKTLIGYKLVREGDLVCNIMLAWNGSLGVSPYNGITSPAYAVYRLNKGNIERYFHYLFRTDFYKAEFKRNSTGVIDSRLRLYSDDFFALWSLLPPLEEQTAIANFLDDKTDKIDTAIAQKERLIELLKERKQIIIQKTVTKGLDSNVKYKDSGIEWIGEIPEHWYLKKTSHLFRKIGSGTTPTSGNQTFYENGTINFLQTGDLNDGYITETSKKVTQSALRQFSALKIYPKGSLVIAMYGATIGKLGILESESTTNQACCVLGKSEMVNSIFMFYSLRGFRNEIISLGYGGGQPNISQDVIKSLKLPIPPIIEQNEIVSYLNNISQQIEVLVKKNSYTILKLKEYKDSLINSAVTGKIKVS